LPGDRLALEIDGACRPNRGQQARGPIGRELPRGAARAQIAQHAVEPVDGATPLAG
jgi:hypothetical protein